MIHNYLTVVSNSYELSAMFCAPILLAGVLILHKVPSAVVVLKMVGRGAAFIVFVMYLANLGGFS